MNCRNCGAPMELFERQRGHDMKTVFGFSTTLQASEPEREAELIAYERMVASMRFLCHSIGRA